MVFKDGVQPLILLQVAYPGEELVGIHRTTVSCQLQDEL